jgi:Ca2+-binding RTX toxin-like protein
LAINGTGNDLANTLTGNSGNNILMGGVGNDTLSGGDGNDVLNGEDGDDVIFGGAGVDTIDGGAGRDTASYSGSGAAVTVNLGTGVNTGGHAQGDVLSNIENLIGSSFHGDTLTGNTDVNRLEGGGGNDTLEGGGGADTLVGGADNDTYVIHNSGVTIIETVNQGADLVQSSIAFTLDDHLENLTLTGSSSTNGTGNGLNNVITGNSNNNLLKGEAGDDTLIGGGGNDTLEGGAGNDTFVIGASHLNSGIFNGGADTDTLKITALANATIDLTGIINANFVSIERIDLTETVGNTVLKLNLESIKSLVDISSGTPTLSVRLDTGDTIDFSASADQTTLRSGNSITIFNNSNNSLTELASVNFVYA